MAWIFLFIAGIFEVVWVVSLKYAENFTRPGPTLLTLSAMVAGILCLSQAIKIVPIGTAYAVWTGVGAVGTAIMGIAFFGESRNIPRVACIFLIVIGIVGLKLTTAK